MRNKTKTKNPAGRMETAALALILAAALCIFVNYITNPDITTTFSGLQVRFAGERELRDRGLVITGRGNIPVSSVVVSGKRKDLVESMDRVIIEADVSDITEEGSYSLKGTIVLPTTKIVVEKEKYGEIPITVEKLHEKEIPIKIRQTGTLKDKLVKSEPEKDTVKLTGAQSELENVSYGVADVDISKISSDTTLPVKYLLLDKSGSYIEKNETLESYTAEVFVKNTVYTIKRLPIKLKLTEEMEEKYRLNEDKCSVSASSVDVGIRPGNSDEFVVVYIDKAESSASEYQLSETQGMYIPENYRTVKVRLDLTEKVTKTIELDPSAEGLTEGLEAQTEHVRVNVTGVEDKINTDNIKARVNLEGLTAGVYEVPVEISGDEITVGNAPDTTMVIIRNA